MRIALFTLLALCAFCAGRADAIDYGSAEDDLVLYDANIEARGKIFRGILDFVQGITNQIKRAIESVVRKAEGIVNDIRTKLEGVAALVRRNLEKMVEAIENRFVKIAETSKATRSCLDKYLPVIKSEIKDAQSSISLCIKGSIEQAKNIVSDVQKYVEAIQDHMDAMNDMVAECLETNGGIVAATKCVWNQISDFKNNIFQIIGDAKDLLVEGTKRAVTIVSDGNKCIFDVARSSEKRIANSVRDLEKCVKAGGDLKFDQKFYLA